MKKLLLFCVLAITVVGCSPSEKSIQKAVAKGDYRYIENYIANPKYWDNPKQTATNVAAVGALIQLNRIDTAAKLYKDNKGKPKEEMIVKAFVNALATSKPQKMPERLVELIDDNRNNSSDTLLRKIAVEIEPAIGIYKIKGYVEAFVYDRKKIDFKSSNEFIKKALLWDIKNKFSESIEAVTSQYSELEALYHNLLSEKSILDSKESEIEEQKGKVEEQKQNVRTWQKDYNDFYYRKPTLVTIGFGCFNNYQSYYFCEESFTNGLKEAKRLLNEERQKLKELELEADCKALKKSISKYEAEIKAIMPEAETAEFKLMEKLNAAGQNNP